MTAHTRLPVLFFGLLMLMATGVLAAGYPSMLAQEIPLYPQSQLDSASEHPRGASVVLNTTGAVEQAARYYRDHLTGKGWQQTADVSIGMARALEFNRNQSSIAISIMPTSAGTTIALTLNQ